jgi:acetoin utilization deacetylase AcuC-like enzyme
MILYDPGLSIAHHDYGIMLPISPSRPDRIVTELRRNGNPSVLDLAAAVARLHEAAAGAVLTRRDLERVHSKEYTAALYGGEGPGGTDALPGAILNAWELIDGQGRPNRYEPERASRPLEEMFDRVLAQAGGTYLACRLALAGGAGFCYYLGGGMHHARYDGGAGFCLINDIVIAARKIQAEQRAELIWVIDVDAHKGCGTAELVQLARNRGELAALDAGGPLPQIFNLSIHMARGWPLDAETLARARPGHAPLVPSDVEIPVEAGAEDRYVPELAAGLAHMRRLSETYAQQRGWQPDAAIVVNGADPYEHDGLASSSLIKLSLARCLERDRLVYDYLRRENIPSAWIMAGGYGERAWEPPAAFLGTVVYPPGSQTIA